MKFKYLVNSSSKIKPSLHLCELLRKAASKNLADKVFALYKQVEVKMGRIRTILVDVYINPSPKEIKELAEFGNIKSVRYYVDSVNKKLYVWTSEVLHLQFLPALHLSSDSVFGDARIKGFKLTHPDISNFCKYPDLKDAPHYEWLNDYFPALFDFLFED